MNNIKTERFATRTGRDAGVSKPISSGNITDSRVNGNDLVIYYATGNRKEMHTTSIDIDELLSQFTMGMVERLMTKIADC